MIGRCWVNIETSFDIITMWMVYWLDSGVGSHNRNILKYQHKRFMVTSLAENISLIYCEKVNLRQLLHQCATLTLDRSTQSSNPVTGRVHILRHSTCWSSIYSRPYLLCNVTRPILVLSACLTSAWIVCISGIRTTRRCH